jgi:predicted dehydrogenase
LYQIYFKHLSKIKIGLAGNPQAIGQYLDYLQKNDSFRIIGSFDSTDPKNFETFYGLSPFSDFIKRADAILFCGFNHISIFDMLIECIRNSKHVLVEKFPDLNYTELSVLQKLNREAGVSFLISNVSGSGCVYTTARQSVIKPSFVQNRITVPFNFNFTDHHSREILCETIDMVLRCVNSPVSKVKVNRQYIFNQKPDEVKLHLTFDNSTTSEVILNTVSHEHSNTLQLYQKGKIIFADIQSFKVEETRLDLDLEHKLPLEHVGSSTTSVAQKMQKFEKKIMYFDVIQKDLLNFVDCISNRVSPLVSIEEALNVVSVMQHFTYSQHESFV